MANNGSVNMTESQNEILTKIDTIITRIQEKIKTMKQERNIGNQSFRTKIGNLETKLKTTQNNLAKSNKFRNELSRRLTSLENILSKNESAGPNTSAI